METKIGAELWAYTWLGGSGKYLLCFISLINLRTITTHYSPNRLSVKVTYIVCSKFLINY